MFAIMIAMASTGWESGLSSSATSVMDFSLQGCSTSVQSSASKKKFFLFDSEALTQHLTLTADALDSLKKVQLANTILAFLKIYDSMISAIWFVFYMNKKNNQIIYSNRKNQNNMATSVKAAFRGV